MGLKFEKVLIDLIMLMYWNVEMDIMLLIKLKWGYKVIWICKEVFFLGRGKIRRMLGCVVCENEEVFLFFFSEFYLFYI